MILTTIRLLDNHVNLENLNKIMVQTLTCNDADFQISLEIVQVLLQHAAFVFKQLSQPANSLNSSSPPDRKAFLQALPPQFDRSKYIEIAAQFQMPESTADKQVTKFLNAGLLIKQAHGNYAKNIINQ